jgi:hypothetical protein
MNMPIPLPLQLLRPQRFAVPPLLHRALLCCAAALVGALLLLTLSAAYCVDAEAGRDDARAGTQKTRMQLSNARETESARAARAKRFALVKAALDSMPAGKPGWERLAEELSAHPHIAGPTLNALPAQPAFPASRSLPAVTLQHVHIEAGLLHEEALLALDAIAAASPPYLIPRGCSLRREADHAPVTLRADCEFDWIALAPPPE